MTSPDSANTFRLRAIFGDPLEGALAVRYIYLDEAGISANEPVSVVAAIIVHADNQWRVAQNSLNSILDYYVPATMREGFVFHAKTLWGSKEIRTQIDDRARFGLLHDVMAIPRQLRIPISIGVMRRGIKHSKPPLADSQWDHAGAFYQCVALADKHIRDVGGPDEVATLVAEDLPSMKKELRSVISYLRARPLVLPSDHLRQTQEQQADRVIPRPVEYKVTRIVDTVHYVDKKDGPLLQIADACAFGFRRFLSRQTMGTEFVRSILAGDINLDDFSDGMSGCTYFWK